MAVRDGLRLYSPEILGLAVELASIPLTDHLPLRGDARSRSCGSTMTIGMGLDSAGGVEKIGMQVTACAIGQASAALFARHAKGRTADHLSDDLLTIKAWLNGEVSTPVWPEIEIIAPAREFPGRHGAILLPWNAAIAALCKEVSGS